MTERETAPGAKKPLLCRLGRHYWRLAMRPPEGPRYTREMGLRCRRCPKWDDPKPFFLPVLRRHAERLTEDTRP